MKKQRKIFCILFLFIGLFAEAQRLKLGVYSAPTMSWLNTNDATIKSSGVQLGYSMGVVADYLIRSRWSLEIGSNLSLRQGGTIQYKTGGNLWPLSELKNPQYNTGPKPIKDLSTLKYNLQFWSCQIGFKRHFREKEYTKMSVNFPTLHIAKLINARGSILQEKLVATDEDIKRDLRDYNLAWSMGVGIEKRIRQSTSVYASLQFMHFLSDLTLNNGFRSNLVSAGDINDPTDDVYEQYDDNTRVLLNSISIKIGLLF